MTGVVVLRRVLLLALSLCLLGCAGLTGMPTERPRVSLADIGIEEISLFEQRLRLVLRVQNPNDIDIVVDGISIELEINDRVMARGAGAQALRIPRFGEATVPVSSVVVLSAVLRQLQEMYHGRQDNIGYRLRGRFNLERVGGVPFDQRGEIPLPALFGHAAGST